MPPIYGNRASYQPRNRPARNYESEGARAGARGVTYGGASYGRSDFLARLMAYARARANQRVYIRPGPGGLGPASPANQPGYQARINQAAQARTRADLAAARTQAYAGRGATYTKKKPATFNRTPFNQEASPYLQRAPVTGGLSPASARALYYNEFPQPEVLPSEGGGGGGGAPGYPGYPSYGGYGGGGGYNAGYRGPAYYGNEQTPRYTNYLRPDIPRWLQAMVTWNIGG